MAKAEKENIPNFKNPHLICRRHLLNSVKRKDIGTNPTPSKGENKSLRGTKRCYQQLHQHFEQKSSGHFWPEPARSMSKPSCITNTK